MAGFGASHRLRAEGLDTVVYEKFVARVEKDTRYPQMTDCLMDLFERFAYGQIQFRLTQLIA